MLPQEPEDDPDFRPFIYESSEDQTDDGQPTPPIEAAEPTLPVTDKRRLGDLRRMAEALQNPRGDTKLAKCTELVSELLQEGFSPILWCRYIATAEYVAKGLHQALRRRFPGLQVVSITSQDGDDEVRAAKLDSDHDGRTTRVGRNRLPERRHQPPGQVQRRHPLRPSRGTRTGWNSERAASIATGKTQRS